MIDRDALIRRIARHEFPDPRVVRQTPRRPGPAEEQGPPSPPPIAYDEPGRPTDPTRA